MGLKCPANGVKPSFNPVGRLWLYLLSSSLLTGLKCPAKGVKCSFNPVGSLKLYIFNPKYLREVSWFLEILKNIGG